MASINPHIHFNGNTEEAFELYKSVFGGSFSRLVRFKELKTEGFSFPEEELNKIMHIALPIGVGSAIMGSDVPSMLGVVNENEGSIWIHFTHFGHVTYFKPSFGNAINENKLKLIQVFRYTVSDKQVRMMGFQSFDFLFERVAKSFFYGAVQDLSVVCCQVISKV